MANVPLWKPCVSLLSSKEAARKFTLKLFISRMLPALERDQNADESWDEHFF